MSEALQPLKGIRVLDLSRVLAGPWCASLLNDLGAEVIKIEMPGSGDDSRSFTPHIGGESSYFMQLNHGKKSVTLDLKAPEGLAILKQLVAQADVLVENFRPGVTKRLGIDYSTLQDINPRLVYASISGFGQNGAMAHKAAYDHIVPGLRRHYAGHRLGRRGANPRGGCHWGCCRRVIRQLGRARGAAAARD